MGETRRFRPFDGPRSNRPEICLCAGSLRKSAAEADPFIPHFLVVPLHIVELDRQFEFGRDQPAGRRGHIELGERRIMLGRDQLRLRREQRLILDQDVEHGAGADQRFLLGTLEGDLRGAYR
jgi:hypothetical protein